MLCFANFPRERKKNNFGKNTKAKLSWKEWAARRERERMGDDDGRSWKISPPVSLSSLYVPLPSYVCTNIEKEESSLQSDRSRSVHILIQSVLFFAASFSRVRLSACCPNIQHSRFLSSITILLSRYANHFVSYTTYNAHWIIYSVVSSGFRRHFLPRRLTLQGDKLNCFCFSAHT